MVCDKVVDCLNAEDELNCKGHTSRASNSTVARAEEDDQSPPPPEGGREDDLAKYYDDQKVKDAFQTLQDAGLLKNVTAGLVAPKFFLNSIQNKTNDPKVTKAFKDLNETGLAQAENLFNVTRVLDKGGDPEKKIEPVTNSK